MIVHPTPLPAAVEHSARFGRRAFPTRDDYARTLAEAGLSIGACASIDAGVLRHWHTTGQTGCLFARLLGRQATTKEWPTFVITDAAPVTESTVETLRATLAAAIDDPDVKLLSIACPTVTDTDQLCAVTSALHESGAITFFEDRELTDHVRVAGRVDIGDGIVAWVMAFGPFDDWPPTRRGPITEFVIRTKPKPRGLFERLNQDMSVAHLADIDLGFDDTRMGRLFDGTERATRDVLGQAPDELSAAKSTYSFPTGRWPPAGETGIPGGRLSDEAGTANAYASAADDE